MKKGLIAILVVILSLVLSSGLSIILPGAASASGSIFESTAPAAVWTAQVPKATQASPGGEVQSNHEYHLISYGDSIITTDSRVISCINKSTGSIIWTWDSGAGGSISRTPVLSGDTLYLCYQYGSSLTGAGKVAALSANTGSVQWASDAAAPMQVALWGGHAIVASWSSNLIAEYDQSNGSFIRNISFPEWAEKDFPAIGTHPDGSPWLEVPTGSSAVTVDGNTLYADIMFSPRPGYAGSPYGEGIAVWDLNSGNFLNLVKGSSLGHDPNHTCSDANSHFRQEFDVGNSYVFTSAYRSMSPAETPWIIALDSQGNIAWQYELTTQSTGLAEFGYGGYTLYAQGGSLYFLSDAGGVVVLNQNSGTLLKDIPYPSGAVDGGGTVLYAENSQMLVPVNNSSNLAAYDSGWLWSIPGVCPGSLIVDTADAAIYVAENDPPYQVVKYAWAAPLVPTPPAPIPPVPTPPAPTPPVPSAPPAPTPPPVVQNVVAPVAHLFANLFSKPAPKPLQIQQLPQAASQQPTPQPVPEKPPILLFMVAAAVAALLLLLLLRTVSVAITLQTTQIGMARLFFDDKKSGPRRVVVDVVSNVGPAVASGLVLVRGQSVDVRLPGLAGKMVLTAKTRKYRNVSKNKSAEFDPGIYM